MKKVVLILFFAIFLGVALAHEFWLMPSKFFYSKGATATIFLQVGENFQGERWKGTITRLSYYFGKQSKNLNVVVDTATRSFQLPLEDEGTQMLVLQNKPSFIELDAEKFNAYLQEDGLEDILEYRKRNGLDKTKGREIYERCAKLIFQVGEKKTETFIQNTNLPLEIVPLDNPYRIRSAQAQRIYFRILFRQKPIAGIKVRFWQKIQDNLYKEEAQTNESGEVSFKFPPAGKVMISAVKMVAHDKPQEADWHSYWASLVFGYEN
ncbi:MAG: DUF4198 domain-containing protein [Raineya sp.]|nr:DUF4198 domain-containing protein [Raineya sp.]